VPTIVFSKAAIRTLTRMPANIADLIREKIDRYAADPRSLGNNVIA
jgi:mRNA interferase RelE/StbE